MAQLRTKSAAPIRPLRPLGRHGTRIVVGDFRTELPKLHKVRTFFTDPPYNFHRTYHGLKDSLPEASYRRMMADMARLSYDAADRDASLFVLHYPEALAKLWPELTKQWQFRNWITWCYGARSGASNTKWTRSSRTILWLTKGNPPFDGLATTRPYLSKPKSTWVASAAKKLRRGAALFDWWVVPQVKRTDPDWSGYAYQVPREIIKRCILATSKPGDLVADPFAGTGSTIKTAGLLGRRGWGCDINPAAQRHWQPVEATA